MKKNLKEVTQLRLWRELINRNQFTALPHILLSIVSYGIMTEMHSKELLSYLPYALVLIGSTIRLLAAKCMPTEELPSLTQQILFFGGTSLVSYGWAMLFMFTHQYYGSYSTQSVYAFLVMAGMISGGVTTFMAHPRGYFFFMLPMTINTAIYSFYADFGNPQLILFCVLFYNIFHVNQLRIAHKYLVASIENDFATTLERDKLSSFIKAVPGFVGFINRDSKYEMLNDFSMSHFDGVDLIGKSIDEYHADSDYGRFVKNFMEGTKETAIEELEINFRNKISIFIVSIQRVSLPLGGAVIVSVPMDELVEARAMMKRQEANAIYSSKLASLGEMAAGIAHEINNPLAIIMGSTDMAIRNIQRPEPSLPKIQSHLDKINQTIFRISAIIKSLKGLARDADKDPFLPCKFENILEPCVEISRQRFLSQNVKFDVNLPENAVELFGREIQLSQVLMNLINNAFDAAVDGPDPKWVRLDVVPMHEHVEISVKDSGNGIPANIKAKIMEPFFTTKGINKGTGLGLSISKSIMEQHGGALVLDESSANTTFVMRLKKPIEA